jgi:hypothetical protein
MQHGIVLVNRGNQEAVLSSQLSVFSKNNPAARLIQAKMLDNPTSIPVLL